MATLSDFEKMLPKLSQGEKAQILNWVVRESGDDFPGVDSNPDVCGGEPCVISDADSSLVARAGAAPRRE